jgi:membrane-associated protein
MDSIIEFFRYLLNSEEIIRTGGLVLISLIIFVENGVIFGFFLPGDYLLFLSGVFAGTGLLPVSFLLLVGCIFGAAVLGSTTGYLTGYFTGASLQTRPDSFFFKKQYIADTRAAFARYGNGALVMARFLPIVRTFAPILAGLIQMPFQQFMAYNVLGGAIWSGVLVGAGFFFGGRFPWIINYVHYIIIFFLAVTTVTVIRGYLNARRGAKSE